MQPNHAFVLRPLERKRCFEAVIEIGHTLELKNRYDGHEYTLAFSRSEDEFCVEIRTAKWRGVDGVNQTLKVGVSDGKWRGYEGTIHRSLVDKTVSEFYRGYSGLVNYSVHLPDTLVPPSRRELIERLIREEALDDTLAIARVEKKFFVTYGESGSRYYRCEIDEDGWYVDGGIMVFDPQLNQLTPVKLEDVVRLRIKVDAKLLDLAEEGPDRFA